MHSKLIKAKKMARPYPTLDLTQVNLKEEQVSSANSHLAKCILQDTKPLIHNTKKINIKNLKEKQTRNHNKPNQQ